MPSPSPNFPSPNFPSPNFPVPNFPAPGSRSFDFDVISRPAMPPPSPARLAPPPAAQTPAMAKSADPGHNPTRGDQR
jgi:hypothetical protein